MSCSVFIIKEIWWHLEKEKKHPLSKANTATDCMCCVGPPIHTATTDTHRQDADTSRQLGILSNFVGCRRRWMWTGLCKVTVTTFSCRVVKRESASRDRIFGSHKKYLFIPASWFYRHVWCLRIWAPVATRCREAKMLFSRFLFKIFRWDQCN
jgi:hypothetical protein